mmetsp:Transcript_2265/g.3905  ORF Transcript_2265/g.3905 Transcript_2265/m.3905 type:complete len:168 (-) Transcript_2265:71-574(-)
MQWLHWSATCLDVVPSAWANLLLLAPAMIVLSKIFLRIFNRLAHELLKFRLMCEVALSICWAVHLLKEFSCRCCPQFLFEWNLYLWLAVAQLRDSCRERCPAWQRYSAELSLAFWLFVAKLTRECQQAYEEQIASMRAVAKRMGVSQDKAANVIKLTRSVAEVAPCL